MSRGVFRSNNKVGDIFSFKTFISSADTFTGVVVFDSGSDRVHWNWGDGSLLDADNSPSHVYSDNGDVKTVTMGTNRLSRLNSFTCGDCKFYGDLDMSGWSNLGPSFNISNSFTNDNSNLTGLTHTYSPQVFTSYNISRNNVSTLDLTMFPNLGGSFQVWSNPNLTSVSHTASTQLFTTYRVDLCDITGNHDVSMLTNLSSNIRFNNNSNLTGITHTGNSNVISNYLMNNCDITGVYDLTMFPNLSGNFRAESNTNLTGILHTASTQTFSTYLVNNCNITGTHDLSMFPGLGGSFNMSSNGNMTEILHTVSTQNFTQYNINSCDITGTHDLSMFPGLGGSVSLYGNSGLSGVTFTASSNTISPLLIHNCNLQGTLDLTMFPNLGGQLQLHNNGNLTDVLLPYTTETFENNINSAGNYAFTLNDCDIGYVNLLPLSGATIDVNYVNGASIDLSDNNMTASEVNHHLVDFDNLSTNLNPSGWSGVTLYIDGTNATPDSSSGGFDGIAAINSLTGSPNNWIITTS